MLPLFLDECGACEALEERVFTDSWTGKELCATCLYEIIGDVTNSPASEGDNLIQLLVGHGLIDEDDEELYSYSGGNESPDPQHGYV